MQAGEAGAGGRPAAAALVAAGRARQRGALQLSWRCVKPCILLSKRVQLPPYDCFQPLYARRCGTPQALLTCLAAQAKGIINLILTLNQVSACAQVLAALGEERENRDGHYAYSAAPAFAESHPLAASNMAAVHAWLDQLLVRPMRAARASSTSAGALPQSPPHPVCVAMVVLLWCCQSQASRSHV